MSKAADMAVITGHKKDIHTYARSTKIVDSTVRIGVEVELENFPVSELSEHTPYWEVVTDHSLRGQHAYEARFIAPLAGVDVIRALRGLEEYVTAKKIEPIASNRTSTHVHIDTSSMTPVELYNWLIIYISVERALYKYCGYEREGSCFCIPTYKAENHLKDMLIFNVPTKEKDQYAILGMRQSIHSAFTTDKRYGGLNLNSLSTLGTIEFRMLTGEWHKAKILKWINMLLSIRKYSMKIADKQGEHTRHVSHIGGERYLRDIFGDYADDLIYPDCERDIMMGIRLAQDVIYPLRSADTYWKLYLIDKKYPLEQSPLSIFKDKNEKVTKKKVTKKKTTKVPPSNFNVPQYDFGIAALNMAAMAQAGGNLDNIPSQIIMDAQIDEEEEPSVDDDDDDEEGFYL